MTGAGKVLSRYDNKLAADSPWINCPACKTLPLEDLRNGDVTPKSELTLNIDWFDLESIREYFDSAECGLCRLVLELRSAWSGEPNHASTKTLSRLYRSPSFHTCALSASTDSIFEICCEHGKLLSCSACFITTNFILIKTAL
jgi:hypothetical protein